MSDPVAQIRRFHAELTALRRDLQARPGASVWLGQAGGPAGCFLHNPEYDFNDTVIPLGAGSLAALAEESLHTPPVIQGGDR